MTLQEAQSEHEEAKKRQDKFYRDTISPTLLVSLNEWATKERPYLGHFLTAVLENNLHGAFSRADDRSRESLYTICQYIYNRLPSVCWGSKEKVEAWQGSEVPAYKRTDPDLVWPANYDA